MFIFPAIIVLKIIYFTPPLGMDPMPNSRKKGTNPDELTYDFSGSCSENFLKLTVKNKVGLSVPVYQNIILARINIKI
jgi:hypothetical protein